MFFTVEHDLYQDELSVFRECFSKPQWRHFKTYLWGIILGEKGEKNVMDIADNALDGKSQSSLNRFLTGGSWDPSTLDGIRLSNFMTDRVGGVLSLDDTLVEKYGKTMEAVGYLFSSSKGKTVRAHNIVSTFYSNGSQKIPLHFAPYLKKISCEGGARHFKTKPQLAVELLMKALAYVRPEMVAFDSWYFGKSLVGFLNSHHQKWVTQSKTNRKLRKDDEKERSVQEYFHELEKGDFRRISAKIDEKRYKWYHDDVVEMRNVGKVRIVYLRRRRNSRGFKALVSNDLDSDPLYLIECYKRRWDIEVFYRDCKQHLGLGEYQVRRLDAVVIHLRLVFLAYTLLKCCRNPGISPILRGIRAIGTVCKRLKRWMLNHLFSSLKTRLWLSPS